MSVVRIPEDKRSPQLRGYHNRKWTEEERKKKAQDAKKWREKNKDYINEKRRNKSPEQIAHRRKLEKEWVKNNPDKKILTRSRGRAKKLGLEFNIGPEDILPLPTHCPILGLELSYLAKVNQPNGYSLDRLDNTKGYVKGNIMIVSFRANILKRDASFEELISLGDWAQKLEGN